MTTEGHLVEGEEFVQTVDSLRSVTLNSTTEGTFVLAAEDPHSVAIVEMTREDLEAVCADMRRRLDGARPGS
jgi:hypothetical protein